MPNIFTYIFFFYLPENCHFLHEALNCEDLFPPFAERLSKLLVIFPVYSTFPLLVIPKAWVFPATVHSRKFHFPEGLGISEGPWMKD